MNFDYLIIIIILTFIIVSISIIIFKFIDYFKKIEEKENLEIKENQNLNNNFNFENIESNNEFSILKTKNIFTKYELIFYRELKSLIKNTNYNLFTKVRIADLIESKNNLNYYEFIKIFNKFNRKHIDFLISDENGKVLLLIELDGYSHNYKKTIESDKLKEKLFSTLKIPLLRFKNGYNHNLEEIKKLLFI